MTDIEEIKKIKGKTFLIKNCENAIKIDASLPRERRYFFNIDMDDDDCRKSLNSTPIQFLAHIIKQTIKEIGGKDNYPFRCTDKFRHKFYYNDNNVGWTEDILNEQLLIHMWSYFNNIALSTQDYIERNKLYTGDDRVDYIRHKRLYIYWTQDTCGSYGEGSDHEKSRKTAQREKIETLNLFADLLDIDI